MKPVLCDTCHKIDAAPIDPSSLERLRAVVGGVAQSLRLEGSGSPGGMQ